MSARYASVLLLLVVSSVLEAVIVTDTSSLANGWAAVIYQSDADPNGDQQTGNAGNEADIVGNSDNPALYKYYGSGDIGNGTEDLFGFRLRLGSQDNSSQGYTTASMIGMDVTGDNVLDFYIAASVNEIGVGGNNGNFDIGIFKFGPDADSPSSTTLASKSDALYGYQQTGDNFSFASVESIDPGSDPADYNLDGATNNQGDPLPDMFISFIVPFADIVAVAEDFVGVGNFDENSLISFVAITSQNLNQINNDFNGIDDSALDEPYGTGGGISDPYTPDGEEPVPEPAAYSLLLGLFAFACLLRRRR